MTDKKDNPYLEMPKDVITQNVDLIKEAMTEKGMQVDQFFGAALSDEDKSKLENYGKLDEKVKELSKAAASKNLSEDTIKLAEASLNREINDLKKLDPDLPIESLTNNKFNALERLDVVNVIRPFVDHGISSINTLKTELVKAKEETTNQDFGAPKGKGADDAAAIMETLLPKKEDK